MNNGSNLLKEFEQEIDKAIHDIQVFRFSYHKEMKSRPINLRYHGFDVKGNTMDTNIVDIAQNAKKFLRSNDPRFLVNNFQLIAAYNEAYDIIKIM